MAENPLATAGESFAGGCLCGGVRFRINAMPLAVRLCWCATCQKIAAGNASVNAIFPGDAIEIEGETAAFASRADSGNLIVRRFCQTCGTPLFAEATARPDVVVVRVGAIDTPHGLKPGRAIWTASAPDWAHIDPALECIAGQPAAVKG